MEKDITDQFRLLNGLFHKDEEEPSLTRQQ